MKTMKSLIMMALAAMSLAVPATSLQAEETSDSTQSRGVTVKLNGMTVNGKPATPQQKAVAKQMTQQGTQMAKKGVQMAVSAVTNPDKAERLGNELEQMGDELERLGDSLATLAEDTTFLYEGEDSDEVELFSNEDLEELRDLKRSFEEKFEWSDTWWGALIILAAGLLFGVLGILFVLLIGVLLFALFTSPIWVLALIIWLIVRGTRTNKTATYQNPPMNPAASQQPDGQPSTNAQPAGQQPAAAAQPAVQPGSAQLYPDENQEMWKSGIMWSCVGVGLILAFLGIGLRGLWGIGALVACIGVAKLVIATTTKRQKHQTFGPSSYEVVEEDKAEDTYQK